MRDFLYITPQGQLALERANGVVVLISSMDDLPDHFSCSSAIDFPEEYTRDPKVIALCRALRA